MAAVKHIQWTSLTQPIRRTPGMKSMQKLEKLT